MSSNTYIDAEVKKIIEDKNYTYPQNAALACAWITAYYKGFELKLLNTNGTSSLADYFLLASTTNKVQASSIADQLSHQMRNHGFNLRSTEGGDEGQWILLDFGDFIVHLFEESARNVYDLDDLYKNSIKEEIPNHYFHGPTEEVAPSENDNDEDDNFF